MVNLDGHVTADESPGLDSSIKVKKQKITVYDKNNFTTCRTTYDITAQIINPNVDEILG